MFSNSANRVGCSHHAKAIICCRLRQYVKRYENALGFLTLAALWGASYPAIRAAKAGVEPLLMAALRFDAIGVVVLGYALARSQQVRPTNADSMVILIGGVGMIGVHNGLLFVGQTMVSGAVGAVVLATIPIWSVGFAVVALETARPTPTRILGIVFGLVGTSILVVPGPTDIQPPDPLGVVLITASAVAFALAAVALRRETPTLGVAARQGWMMLVGGTVLHAASLARGEPQTVALTPDVLIAFGFLVLAAGVVGYLLYYTLLDRLGPVEVNLFGYVAPVFAATTGWIFLDERLAATTIVGFLVIAVGFALIKRNAIRDALIDEAAPATGD